MLRVKSPDLKVWNVRFVSVGWKLLQERLVETNYWLLTKMEIQSGFYYIYIYISHNLKKLFYIYFSNILIKAYI